MILKSKNKDKCPQFKKAVITYGLDENGWSHIYPCYPNCKYRRTAYINDIKKTCSVQCNYKYKKEQEAKNEKKTA